jgi:hypothetical protein
MPTEYGEYVCKTEKLSGSLNSLITFISKTLILYTDKGFDLPSYSYNVNEYILSN